MWRDWAAKGISLTAALYVIIVIPFYLMPLEQQLAIFTMLMVMFVFAKHPVAQGIKFRTIASLIDIILLFLCVAASVYQIMAYRELLFERPGMVATPDVVFGIIMILLVLEATRRSASWVLVGLGAFFIFYALFGKVFPASIAHRGYGLDRVALQSFLTLDGIYGLPMQVLIQYVGLFVAFGNVLEAAGGAQFLIDVAKAVAGRITGGLAHVAIVASSLMGTISGSAVANVATTGCVTIPAMKKGGYPPFVAGAVEAVASTGGQLMPPIMGAAAFLMADYLGIPYLSVVKAAIIPAILYYLAVFFAVYFYSAKSGFRGARKEELPNFGKVMRTRGYLLVPIGIIIYMLVAGWSPTMAGFYGLMSSLVLSFVQVEYRKKPLKLLSALGEAGVSLGSLAPISATAGLVVGILSMTGLGPRISSMLVSLAGGSGLLLLLLTAGVSIIMGMGMPTTAVYIILATLVAPALAKFGFLPIVAHFFIFYFGMMSMITPPVALAAYAGAAIAEDKPERVGWMAFRLALPTFLIPFMFVYYPGLALQGSLAEAVRPILTSVLGVILISGSAVGYLFFKVSNIERILLGLAGVLLVEGSTITDVFGGIVLGAIVLRQAQRGLRRQRSIAC